jgi:regulator of RNase E activity RraA
LTPKLPPENARGSVPLGRRDLAALRAFSTPAVCDAIAELAPEYRACGFTSGSLQAMRSGLPPIVGYACTAAVRTAAVPPPDMDIETLTWIEHLSESAMPAIAVVQDLDGRHSRGACWDGLLAAMHVALGCVGLVTDGTIRGLGGFPGGFQVLAAGMRPSAAWPHYVEIGGQVAIAGLTVTRGDILHADASGAVVVPAELVRDIPDAIGHIRAHDAEILAACRAPGVSFETIKPLLLGHRQTRWCF